MAHHLAELIRDIETAPAKERSAKLAECRNAILDVWKVRHEFPEGKRPFQAFEGIFRALNSLDPNSPIPRFYAPPLAGDAKKESAETKKWLEITEGIDYTARILIRYCISEAIARSSDKLKKWAELATAATGGHDTDVSVIGIILSERNFARPVDPKALERRQLRNRLKRLEVFRKFSIAIASQMRAQLEATASAPKPAKRVKKHQSVRRSPKRALRGKR